jgi:Insertion element 4 transposase N-terminal
VTGSLSDWGCWNAAWSVPTASGITQARKRLGRDVMPEIFEGVAEAVATADTRGAWLREWRLLAIDGFEVDLADTPGTGSHRALPTPARPGPPPASAAATDTPIWY